MKVENCFERDLRSGFLYFYSSYGGLSASLFSLHHNSYSMVTFGSQGFWVWILVLRPIDFFITTISLKTLLRMDPNATCEVVFITSVALIKEISICFCICVWRQFLLHGYFWITRNLGLNHGDKAYRFFHNYNMLESAVKLKSVINIILFQLVPISKYPIFWVSNVQLIQSEIKSAGPVLSLVCGDYETSDFIFVCSSCLH